MASPQKENGRTEIANELYDAINAFDFSKRQAKVLHVIIRKTYGWNKTWDDITVAQIAKLAGIDRAHASRAINDLVELNAVLKRHGRHGYLLKVQKNYEKWGRAKTARRAKTAPPPCQNGTQDRAKTAHTKDNLQKTTPKGGARARRAGARAPRRPDPIPDGLVVELWDEWIEYRQGCGKWPKLKQRTINRDAAKLAALTPAQQRDVVHYSIDNYRALYFDRAGNGGNNRESPQSPIDAVRQAHAQFDDVHPQCAGAPGLGTHDRNFRDAIDAEFFHVGAAHLGRKN